MPDVSLLYSLNYIRRHQKFWQVDVPHFFQPAVKAIDGNQMSTQPSYMLTDFYAEYARALGWTHDRTHEALGAFDCIARRLAEIVGALETKDNMNAAEINRLLRMLPSMRLAPEITPPGATLAPGPDTPGAGRQGTWMAGPTRP
ncbi:MAG: hypothetical protein V7603_6401 [Micromonosporaceae bacterium]